MAFQRYLEMLREADIMSGANRVISSLALTLALNRTLNLTLTLTLYLKQGSKK